MNNKYHSRLQKVFDFIQAYDDGERNDNIGEVLSDLWADLRELREMVQNDMDCNILPDDDPIMQRICSAEYSLNRIADMEGIPSTDDPSITIYDVDKL